MTVDIHQIDERLREIGQEVARLQKEAEELAIAKRVFERFPDKSLNGSGPKTDPAPEGRPRPGGTPTNYEMTEFVLAAAEKEDKDGLTANEIVQAISARYWPGLIGTQILPSIYKFAKEGRLHKTPKGKFKRVHKKTVGEGLFPSPTE